MANLFTNKKAGSDSLGIFFSLSNGATEVLIDAIVLSASDLAQTDWQKLFVCWLAGHDQDYLGRGVVGFDIDDVGWTKEEFETEKAFVLKAIDMAMQKFRWDVLSYSPGDMTDILQDFRELVAAYQASFIETDNEWGRSLIEPGMEFQLCPTHRVYMHSAGCHICD